MSQDQETAKRLEDSQAELIKSLLLEAEEHKKADSIKLLKEVAENSNISLDVEKTNDNKTKKKIKRVEVVDEIESDDEDLYEIDDFDIPHDLIPIPSNGLVYKGVRSKVPVAYLTASDEDLITSPNLYADGKIIDLLLRKKILDRYINPDNLCKGDRDAIIIWLRASGYGSMFPVSVKDPVTGDDFEYEVDLSKLKFKKFNLKPDIDGYFDFKLPKTEHEVKFKFLSHKDELAYVKFLEKTNVTFKKNSVKTSLESLKLIIENDSDVDSKIKTELEKALLSMDSYLTSISLSDDNLYLKNVTYLLEKSIVSINGVSDKSYIKKYVKNMPALDSMKLRKYINDNTPGIDFKITVERPESLGGGSFDTFLELDSTIFLNIPRL
jgi:hypothetical protein